MSETRIPFPTNDEIAAHLEGRLFDAIDWHLTLYENGDVDYDQTIRNIITSAWKILEGKTP